MGPVHPKSKDLAGLQKCMTELLEAETQTPAHKILETVAVQDGIPESVCDQLLAATQTKAAKAAFKACKKFDDVLEFTRGGRLKVCIDAEAVEKAWADTLLLRKAVAMHFVINALFVKLEQESDRLQTLQNVLNDKVKQHQCEHILHPVLDRLIVKVNSKNDCLES